MKVFKDSVPWLLGPQLIAGLRRIISYEFLRNRLDQRNWMTGSKHREYADAPCDDEFWWDYVADTGDGQRPMFNLAGLLYADLYVTPKSERKDGKNELSLKGEPGAMRLPRGSLLVVGGDTAYHVADADTLQVQFQKPFQEAWHRLAELGYVDKESPRRPLFGVPGNHDYYDEIEGFQFQFRSPAEPEDKAELALPGFARHQQASYVAIALPKGWWFWGVDNEIGHVDERQKQFFANIPKERLIVATPEPSTVNGLWATVDAPHAKVFGELALPRPFLAQPELLPATSCRLDLSGDTHNYQRYFGPEKPGGTAEYASVVSGGGGAFMHPTCVDFGEVPKRAEFPPAKTARDVITRSNLHASHIARGGLVAVIGGFIAAIIYAAATFIPTTHAMVARVLGLFFRLCHTRHELPVSKGPCDAPEPLCEFGKSAVILVVLAFAVYVVWRASRYARARVGRASTPRTSLHRYRVSVTLVIAAVLLCWTTISLLGNRATATEELANVLTLFFALALVGGLTALALKVGASDQHTTGKIGFAVIGLCHGILQLFLPLTLMWMLSWQAFLAQIAVGFVVWALGYAVVWLDRRGWLLILWIASIIAQLAIPRWASGSSVYMPPWGWGGVVCIAAAFVVGYVSTAVALGWYFAVCLDLNGHGNEAAVVARIENYKQFIRFKIDNNGDLTAYVIALEQVHDDLRALRPHITDSFTISPRSPSPPA